MPCPLSPRCDKCGFSHPLTSALLKGKNAITAVVITIILPHADDEDPDDHPTIPETWSVLTDCPEVPGQGTPKMTGTDQAIPPGKYHQCLTSHNSSCSPSHNLSPYQSNQSPICSTRQWTPFWYKQDSIKVILCMSQRRLPVDRMSIRWPNLVLHPPDASYQEWDQVHDWPWCSGKHNIPDNYQKLFPFNISESRYPKPGTLLPTSDSRTSHDGKPQPFLGHFIAKVTEPRLYPTHFYMFEDATSAQILL